MSVKIMSLVWERAPYSSGSLLVLLALADWANDDGIAWPSMDRLANKARIDRRSAQRIVRQLERDGVIEIERGGGRSKQHRYILKVETATICRPLHEKETATPTPPFTEINSDIRCSETATFDAQRATFTTQRATPTSPDPLDEPLDKPLLEPPYCGLDFLTALATFKDHRKQIKRPLSLDGLRLLYKKLSTWPESVATQALEDAVINRWQGVFEPKGFRNGTHEKNGAGGEYQTLAQRGRAAGFDGLLSVVDELRASSSGGTDEAICRKPITP